MAEISASLVKQLREMTGAGMMDCKKALAENAGNLDESVDWLRKKGLAAAAKKAGRVAAEGLVAAVVDGKEAALVELNAETDFVARNEEFQSFLRAIAHACEHRTHAPLPAGHLIFAGHLLRRLGDEAAHLLAQPLADNDDVVPILQLISENRRAQQRKRRE